VKRVKISGSEIDFTIELTTPACPVKDQFEGRAERLVAGLPGITAALRAKYDADTRARGGFSRQRSPASATSSRSARQGGVGQVQTSVNWRLAGPKRRARRLMDADV